MDLAEAVRSQAAACGSLGSPMYADLLARVADDVAAGGPSAHVLREHVAASGPSGVALRLAGSVHRLVLQRRAGALAAYYPSVGGTWSPEHAEGCWEAFRALLAAQAAAVEEWLDRPPQTNEVGRSAGLMGALLVLMAERERPVRLAELGSSGGLNLLVDRFRYTRTAPDGTRASVGPADSPVLLSDAWAGLLAPPSGPWPRVVERLGSDVMPVDVRSTEGRLALTAYVWPDQHARHERLRGALAIAATTPYDVRRLGAADAVAALELRAGALTVLWHSVMWQYLDPGEQERVRAGIDELGARATDDAPFAHVYLEPTRREPGSDHEFLVAMETWPARAERAAGERVVLAATRGHGLPTMWEHVPAP